RFRRYQVCLRKEYRTADNIPEFSKIPRPAVLRKHIDHIWFKSADIFAKFFICFLQEEICKCRDVLSAIAQWREINGKLVESMIQIFSELPFLVCVLQILVGRNNDSHIYIHFLVAAN